MRTTYKSAYNNSAMSLQCTQCTKKREKILFEPELRDRNHLEHKKRKCQSTERRPMGKSYEVHGAEISSFERKAPNQPPVYDHMCSIDLTEY